MRYQGLVVLGCLLHEVHTREQLILCLVGKVIVIRVTNPILSSWLKKFLGNQFRLTLLEVLEDFSCMSLALHIIFPVVGTNNVIILINQTMGKDVE